jgi:hypothetical protein
MRLARRLLIAVMAALFSFTIGAARSAHADEVADLSRTLLHSKQHKERIGAAVTLGRLEDRRALSALVKALDDEHHNVRALAAVALGRIGDPSALPALQKALKDPHEVVRRRAREAIEAIQKKGQQGAAAAPGPAPEKGTPPGPGPGTRGYKVSAGKGDPGFGRNPRKVVRPEVYVSLQSAADRSTARTDPQARSERAEQMKKLLSQELEATPEITTDVRVARKLRIAEYNLDASITRLTRRVQGGFMEIECEIHVAISDTRGKILSFMTGGAKVQVPRRSFKKQYLERLQHEALENAVKGVHQDLLAHLRRHRPG